MGAYGPIFVCTPRSYTSRLEDDAEILNLMGAKKEVPLGQGLVRHYSSVPNGPYEPSNIHGQPPIDKKVLVNRASPVAVVRFYYLTNAQFLVCSNGFSRDTNSSAGSDSVFPRNTVYALYVLIFSSHFRLSPRLFFVSLASQSDNNT